MGVDELKACDIYRQGMEGLEPRDRILIAYDEMSHQDSAQLSREIDEFFGMAKENANADSSGYADSVERNRTLGKELMADPKYNDTPRTMASHITSTGGDGAHFITMHVSSGRKSRVAAVEARDKLRASWREEAEETGIEANTRQCALLGITVLTSISDEECREIFGMPVREKVVQFAGWAFDDDMDGVVCAGDNLEDLMANPKTKRLIKVVPALILPGDPMPSGQERVMTISEAIAAGADFAVVGSAVTKKPDRRAAARMAVEQVKLGLEMRSARL